MLTTSKQSLAGRVFNLLVVLASLRGGPLAPGPAHPHPYAPAEWSGVAENGKPRGISGAWSGMALRSVTAIATIS